MTENKKVWFITGAGRGMGVEFAKAVLASGDKVVATGRNTSNVAKVLGEHNNLLIAKLDIRKPEEVEAVVKEAVEKFGKIDVLLNNAGNFYGGYFEEFTPEQLENQIATNLIGTMNVTRAVLPVMRKARSGHIISISSSAGIVGFEYNSAYAASKFALEGWLESLRHEIAPFSIKTTVIEPAMFRTEFLEPNSTTYAELSIEDYAERNEQFKSFFKDSNRKQPGDPVKLAQALMTIANQEEPPFRFLAGKGAVEAVEEKIAELQKEINDYRSLSISLDY